MQDVELEIEECAAHSLQIDNARHSIRCRDVVCQPQRLAVEAVGAQMLASQSADLGQARSHRL
jgi:hypothetical protein